jgi:serine/threonine protein kinase/superfamily II DNA/RNA helicase/very-short-patch-repair endonuclease
MNGAEVIAGRFAILRPLARGNMGQVSEALDELTGEKVAVKTMLRRRNGALVSLREADKNAIRFQREVRIMSRLHSDNLPRIIDGGLDGDQPYLAMEYVPGMTLADLIAKEGRLPVAWAAAIGAQIAAGLAVAHRASVVHRDLKPSNVMMTPDGVVKVLDFGVGLILDDVDGEPLTSVGVTIGTARYMSPEQAKAEAITPATDLYALGCVLYEMLTGASPFDGDTAYELMNQQVEQTPLPVSSLRSEVPEALGQLVSRLLEKDPSNRPADADEVAAALRPFVLASGAQVPGPDPTRPILSAADVTEEAETWPSTDMSGELKAAAEGEFDIFDVHRRLISDYRAFTEGAAVIRDPRIAKFMEADLDAKSQWPDPWLSLNPFFADGGSVTDLVDSGLLHPECARIFQGSKTSGGTVCDGRPIRFYQHQREAIEAAGKGVSYVLTTGTGSGKSLAYIVPIVDRVLRAKETDQRQRVRAIIVYPMNALANSQIGELEKFLRDGYPPGGSPVTFERYTGQEDQEDRDRIRANPPDILLTNYVMLELMLTRPDDRRSLIRMAEGLEFLVFDELHTYRGRQGADVAMLIRRVKDACAAPDVRCIGTSATMSTEGGSADRREKVAEVASQLFGVTVLPENVIGETLVRATGEDAGLVTIERIIAPVAPADYVDLVRDPLASWAETSFGLDRDEEGRLARRAPTTVQLAAAQLAGQTRADAGKCEKALQRTLQAGSRARHPHTGRPLFAFRLHQFLSKGDTVYVTLEDESSRHITRDYQVEQPGSGGKVLLPLAFCRECGQEYLVVWRRYRDGEFRYTARRDASVSAGGDSDGYLYLSSDMPWPRDLDTVIAERRLPDSWLEVSDRTGQDVVRPTARKYLPDPVTVDVTGRETPATGGIEAAFLPGPFRFCLRCGVSYEQVRGRDFAKLATLDQEGRSSATSLISTSIMRSLQAVPPSALDPAARKLLTFVDNRQDASLQSGHFNDFVQVTMLRGALYRAARDAADRGEDGLFHEDIATAVTKALALDRSEYALQPGEDPAMRKRTDAALRDVVNLRVYRDLERGWRITMPNLEQTGLLTIGYLGLDGAAGDEALWEKTAPALRTSPPEARMQICTVLLNEMRRSLAIDVECFEDDEFDRIRRRSQGSLRAEWAVSDTDQPRAAIVVARPGRAGGARDQVSMSGRGKFGRYIKRRTWFPGYEQVITSDDAQRVIHDLLEVLAAAGLVTKVEDPYRRGMHGYRVRATGLIWRPGDGSHGADDPLSRSFPGAEKPRVNSYFVGLYRNVASELAGLVAREHTAQVDPQVREEREEEFRLAELKLLYCSPTMELGVDIAGLNAVAMRNVPPTPANYAQRSGRAGRSGQPALVTTYCATGNSHDQYYFRRSERMVAGSVAPPRLDLLNEDLIRSHVHAIWVAEAGLKLGRKIPETIDMDGTEPEGRRRPDPALQLRRGIAEAISSPDAARRAVARAHVMLRELEQDLEKKTSWWYPEWIEHVTRDAPRSFDRAFDRWRDVYRAALVDQWEQNRRRLDHSLSQRDRDIAGRRRNEAETQLRLLGNEDTDARNLTADFNPYRYLASEGFLPGYSFPRLPIAAYIPVGGRSRRDGDYVQRPRFLAIKEFGPRALIYHEGARYEVARVQLPPDSAGEVVTYQAHRCGRCGYHHEVAPGNDRCEMCGIGLSEPLTGLLPLHTVFTRQRERISSDEEERRRAGFRVVTSYRFQDHGDRPGQLDAIVRDAADAPVARLSYGDSATVRRTNLGPTRKPADEADGFLLDPVTGKWETKNHAAAEPGGSDDDSQPADRCVRVVPFVQDRRNILVLQLTEPTAEEAAGSVMFALERGIEAVFQLEDSELDSELLPPEDGPRDRMLFTESAEGGAGVLRRLQAEKDALARAAREALRIAHFDPDTGADLGGRDGGHPCGKACYDCLLSYRNQLVHELIDRHRARDLLLAIAGGVTLPTRRGQSRTEQSKALISQADSSLEARFVQWLKDNGYRLPDQAQVTVTDAYARPDFVYQRPNAPVAVFVDGPVHDDEATAQRDAAAAERLEDLGWYVIRVRHDDDWQDIASKNPTVFGSGR